MTSPANAGAAANENTAASSGAKRIGGFRAGGERREGNAQAPWPHASRVSGPVARLRTERPAGHAGTRAATTEPNYSPTCGCGLFAALGAKPRRMVFSVTLTGIRNWCR